MAMTTAERESGKAAIRQALKALRRRQQLEEGAHGPAIEALRRPFAAHALEWKEKAEKLDLELQQCYKATSRLSQQLMAEIEDCKKSKVLVQEKETLIASLQNELETTREENIQFKQSLDEKTKSLDLILEEHKTVKEELEKALKKLKDAETENKDLISRWMDEKLKDAEKLNEANAMYAEMVMKLQFAGIGGIQLHAQKEADGVVRQTEAGYEEFAESPIPSTCRLTIRAYEGSPDLKGTTMFLHNSDKLISGGYNVVKIWNTQTGSLSSSLTDFSGSVLDLAVTNENKFVIAASSDAKLYCWEVNSGRKRHTLTGHTDKVCCVDSSKFSSSVAASGATDHTIKIWDLNRGISTKTIMSASNCNSIAFIGSDTFCSGHTDGNIRLFDLRYAKPTSQVAAHGHVTWVCMSRSGNYILTSGRDNVHNLFDVRTLEICETFRAVGNRVVSSWGRPCISADERCIAAGSSDGSIYVWSRLKNGVPTILEGHAAPVLSCSWSNLGKPLASCDKKGNIYIWT